MEDKGASNKESGFISSNIGKDMSQTENDDQEKINLTKTDPLSIKKSKRDTFKRAQRQNEDFYCEEDCFFRGKEFSLEPGVWDRSQGKPLIPTTLRLREGRKRKLTRGTP